MSTINNALVSYEQVIGAPYRAPIAPKNSIVDRYSRLEQYTDNKKTDVSTSEETPTAEKFRWYYDGGSKPKTTTSMSTTSTSAPNNTPIIPKNEWVNQLSQAYRKNGVSENGIRNLIAKNALRIWLGTNQLKVRYNYGNITTGSSWKGDYVNGK